MEEGRSQDIAAVGTWYKAVLTDETRKIRVEMKICHSLNFAEGKLNPDILIRYLPRKDRRSTKTVSMGVKYIFSSFFSCEILSKEFKN